METMNEELIQECAVELNGDALTVNDMDVDAMSDSSSVIFDSEMKDLTAKAGLAFVASGVGAFVVTTLIVKNKDKIKNGIINRCKKHSDKLAARSAKFASMAYELERSDEAEETKEETEEE